MSFGNQTVTIVARSDAATPGVLGTYAQAEALTALPGCRHRPLTFKETAELEFDIATEMWRTTIPIGEYSQGLQDAVMAITPGDAIRVDGQTYEIVGGVRPHNDFTAPFKATIISKKHIG